MAVMMTCIVGDAIGRGTVEQIMKTTTSQNTSHQERKDDIVFHPVVD